MNINTQLSHRNEEPEKGVLYFVGTPIGNLSDISSRAIHILQNVSLILCEDTRQTCKLLNKFGIKNKLISFNKYNSNQKLSQIIDKLKIGEPIALTSDAGLPGISDPGEELAKEARKEDIDVICVPGPCAALTALVASGLPSSKFIFEGFLPKKGIDREKVLQEISNNVKTTVIFESPHRLKRLLKELKIYCGGERELIIAKELTKRYEQHIGSNIDEVINFFDENEVLGEYTIVIKGTIKDQKIEFDELKIKEDLKELINYGLSLSSASKYISKRNNLSRKYVYNLLNKSKDR